MKLLRVSLFAASLVVGLPLAGCSDLTFQPYSCQEGCLIARTTDLATHKTSLSPMTRVTENGKLITPLESWLAGATSVKIHGSYAYLTAGVSQAMVLGTGTGADGRPAIFGLHTRLSGSSLPPEEAELIVAHQGEASLFPTSIPLQRDAIMDETVPPGRGTGDADMIAAANAYFDGIETKSGAKVPVTPDCERVENGVQTTGASRPGSPRCNSLEGFDYIKAVRDRRFPLVDYKHGVVVANVVFDIPGGDYPRTVDGKQTMRNYRPRSLLLFEVFKIEDGKIRHIQATMRDMPLGTPSGEVGQQKR